MKRMTLAFLAMAVLIIFCGSAWSQCPEQPLDAGECDTLHVKIYDWDYITGGTGPFFIRFPIYVTNDLESAVDSIAGFQIPLCYTLSNITGTVDYCSLSTYWNTLSVNPTDPAMARSVFRDLPDNDHPEIFNRMFSLARDYSGRDWDTKILNLGDGVSQFFLALVPTGDPDQKWWEGYRTLLATMTFKTNFDPVTSSFDLCIDSCWMFPVASLAYANSLGDLYVPRHFLPECENIRMHVYLPPEVYCPGPQLCKKNGSYSNNVDAFTGGDATIRDAWCSFEGEGVENVRLINEHGSGSYYYSADVAYDVVNHCGTGGTITIGVENNVGTTGYCEFDIVMGNDPPQVNVPDVLNTASDCGTRGFLASASDPNDDQIISFTMDAFWCQDDSLRVPTVPPNFDGTNPGEFWWNPGEGDQGSWIALFSAEDECGLTNSKQTLVEVGSVCCGDANGDGYTNLGDVIYLIGYLYRGEDPPDPLCKGNVNCDSVLNLSDVIYLLGWLFKGGAPCCFDCCEGW